MKRRTFVSWFAALLAADMVSTRASARTRPLVWNDVALIDGGTLPATALRGSAVVVEFWASWCPFCMRQNPILQELHQTSSGRGLQVLTFSIDDHPAKARAYLAEHRFTFPAAMAGPQSARWFGRNTALPELFVVDPDGDIVYHERGEMFPEDIRALVRFADARSPARDPR